MSLWSFPLEFVPLEDPILHQPVPTYSGNFEELRPLAKAMFEKMLAAGGIGMAAPQVGAAVRMFVMALPGGMRYTCVNPKIELTIGPMVPESEGCLTWPGELRTVLRPQTILARWTDLYGQTRGRKLTGTLSRCFQHETEHLDGITIYDGD